jgi:hypothetical protein
MSVRFLAHLAGVMAATALGLTCLAVVLLAGT